MKSLGYTVYWICLLFICSSAYPCIHPPADFSATISEKEKTAFLFHDGVNSHLVLNTVLTSSASMPDKLAWVIPLPSLPSAYEEIPLQLFSGLQELIPRLRRPDPPVPEIESTEMQVASDQSIEIHETVNVGDYEIQPVEILSESAGSELNSWLDTNGFGTVPPENQRFYLKQGAVFLAVKVRNLLNRESPINPIHIIYQHDRMLLPLKFSSHSGVFDVRLYTFTDKAPSRRVLESFGLKVNDASYFYSANSSEKGEGDRSFNNETTPEEIISGLLGARSGYITEFTGAGYNEKIMVTALSDDPWLLPSGMGPGGEPGGLDSAEKPLAYPLFSIGEPRVSKSSYADVSLIFFINFIVISMVALLYKQVRKLKNRISTGNPADHPVMVLRPVFPLMIYLSILIFMLWINIRVFDLWGTVPELVEWYGGDIAKWLFLIGVPATFILAVVNRKKTSGSDAP